MSEEVTVFWYLELEFEFYKKLCAVDSKRLEGFWEMDLCRGKKVKGVENLGIIYCAT